MSNDTRLSSSGEKDIFYPRFSAFYNRITEA